MKLKVFLPVLEPELVALELEDLAQLGGAAEEHGDLKRKWEESLKIVRKKNAHNTFLGGINTLSIKLSSSLAIKALFFFNHFFPFFAENFDTSVIHP